MFFAMQNSYPHEVVAFFNFHILVKGKMSSNSFEISSKPSRKVSFSLSGGDEWKVVAEKLGLTPRKIRFLDNRTLNPLDAALAFLANQRHINVGSLYDVLIECGYPVVADDM